LDTRGEAGSRVLCRLREGRFVLQTPVLIPAVKTCTEYAYLSPHSDSWPAPAGRFVGGAVQRLLLNQNSFVVRAASNEGYFLKHIVDPAEAVAGFGSRP